MTTIDVIFQLIILLFSVILHEVAHGYAALFQGDPTAKYENRLTLNPVKHIDLFGSIVLPFLLFLSHMPIFGWAKPVPFNPYNLKNKKWGELLVAIAGPLTNLFIAIVFGLIIRFGAGLVVANPNLTPAFSIMAMIVVINISLALFNLMPVPPLDGSKILFAFLPASMSGVRRVLEQYAFLWIVLFIFGLWSYVAPLAGVMFYWFTGIKI